MEEKQKKIEEMNGFRDLRIVDNFFSMLSLLYCRKRLLCYGTML